MCFSAVCICNPWEWQPWGAELLRCSKAMLIMATNEIKRGCCDHKLQKMNWFPGASSTMPYVWLLQCITSISCFIINTQCCCFTRKFHYSFLYTLLFQYFQIDSFPKDSWGPRGRPVLYAAVFRLLVPACALQHLQGFQSRLQSVFVQFVCSPPVFPQSQSLGRQVFVNCPQCETCDGLASFPGLPCPVPCAAPPKPSPITLYWIS